MGNTNLRTYTKKEATMYLLGMFGQNAIYGIISTGLYFYFQNVICLPAVALGWIFAIARVWDAINDPMMGTLVDRTNTKWGKCRPFLIFAPPVIGVITIATFLNGNYATAMAEGNHFKMAMIVAWAAVSYICWGMSYTVGDIPLWGIIARMSEVEEARAKLISMARISAAIGSVLATFSIEMVSQSVNSSLGLNPNAQKGFIIVSVVMTVISTLLFECAGVGTKEHVVTNNDEKKGFIASLKIAWNCKPFRRILISGIIRSPMQLFMTVIMTLLTYYYCNGDLNNAFSAGNVLAAIALLIVGFGAGEFGSMILVPILMKKWDVKTIYNATGALSLPIALLYVVYKVAPTGMLEIGWVAICAFLLLFTGASIGIVNVCQSVMITDCIDYEEYHTGYRPDGVFFSGQSFITKLSSGLSSLISAYVYAAVGYSDANIDKMNQALANGASFANDYASYSDAMWLLITIPVAIGFLLAIIPTWKYEITPEHRAEITEALKIRHDAAAMEKAEETAEAAE